MTTSSFTQFLSSVLQCCFTSKETTRLIRDGEPTTATSTFTQLLTSVLQCCFTSTETIRLIGDGEPMMTNLVFHTAPDICSPPSDVSGCLCNPNHGIRTPDGPPSPTPLPAHSPPHLLKDAWGTDVAQTTKKLKR